MTRDEIQKLIGGYATGSLTESQRKLLFDAALEDQELFDQLANEQALKELLEEPGVKQRLLTALGPEKPSRVVWNQWPWAIGAAAACLAIVIGMAVLRTPEKPREIAAVTRAPETPAPAIATQDAAPTTPPGPQPAQVRSKPKAAEPVAENAPARPLQAVPTPPPAPAESPKAEKTAQPSVDAIQEVAVAPAPAGAISSFRADQTPPAQAGQIQVGGAPTAAAGKGGGRGGGGGGRAPQIAAARAVAIRFAFDYSFDAAGALRIVPAAQGYLSVSVPPAGLGNVLLPSRNVPPGTPIIVPVPADASELIVSFSASQAAVTGTPARREESAGTVEDQSQRIFVTIPVKR